jgi:hypothetical protein
LLFRVSEEPAVTELKEGDGTNSGKLVAGSWKPGVGSFYGHNHPVE